MLWHEYAAQDHIEKSRKCLVKQSNITKTVTLDIQFPKHWPEKLLLIELLAITSCNEGCINNALEYSRQNCKPKAVIISNSAPV